MTNYPYSQRDSVHPDNSFEGLGLNKKLGKHLFVPMSDEYPENCAVCGKASGLHLMTTPDTEEEVASIATIHAYAKDKGWWDIPGTQNPDGTITIPLDAYEDLLVMSKMFLIISEIVEAGEFLRNGNKNPNNYVIDDGKPEGFGVELVDADIRLLDLLGHLGMDDAAWAKLRNLKHNYNLTRSRRHGGKRV